MFDDDDDEKNSNPPAHHSHNVLDWKEGLQALCMRVHIVLHLIGRSTF